MHLTLLVPELIWPEPADQFTLGKLSVPGLEWLLARARFEQGPRLAFEHSLAACLGLDTTPFGPLRLLGEGCSDARDGHWLCADPVHLRFHHERIVLADAGAFELSDDEARQITASLNLEFPDVGHFHVADARRWYLRLRTPIEHRVGPLSSVAGRRVDDELPEGDSTLTRWLNEVQMFLHGHPVNEQRQSEGKPIINSLWLWGGGELPIAVNKRFSDVWSNNPLAAGLAQAGAMPLHAVPGKLEEFLSQAGDKPLVVLDALLPRVLYEDGEGWRNTLEQLDADWFAPLGKALGNKIQNIELIAPTIFGELRCTLRASDRWKFWKHSQALSNFALQLAEQAQP